MTQNVPGEPEAESRVLILAPIGRDAALASVALEDAGVRTRQCRDVDELSAEIRAGAGAVLMTEEALTPGTAGNLADVFRGQLPWSDLPLLVFSGGSVRRETLPSALARLAELANVTLMDRPTRKLTLVSSVKTALRARRRQYEVRDLVSQLETNVRDRDRFLAILSHELRNPIAAITTATELMERRRPADAPGERSIIERQTMLLSKLVDDLLDVARVTRGKILLKRSPLDVSDLVDRALQSIAPAAAVGQIRLSLVHEGEPFTVDGDRFRLEQVIHNLLTNAIKYTPPGGEIRVTLARSPEAEVWGEIRIVDSGTGIDPEILPKIFDPFAQADATIERSQGGLGLGLTLVRELVELHGGTVRAESAGRGRGSTFVVRLPTSTQPHAATAVLPSRPAEAIEPRGRILLVEDNLDVRSSLGDLLRDSGFEVFDAGDGEEGVAAAVRVRPDTVLVDIGLPRLDGYGVARRLRRELADRVHLVALTGYGSGDDRRRAFDAGFDDHLTKPVTLRAVLDLIERRGRAAGDPPPLVGPRRRAGLRGPA